MDSEKLETAFIAVTNIGRGAGGYENYERSGSQFYEQGNSSHETGNSSQTNTGFRSGRSDHSQNGFTSLINTNGSTDRNLSKNGKQRASSQGPTNRNSYRSNGSQNEFEFANYVDDTNRFNLQNQRSEAPEEFLPPIDLEYKEVTLSGSLFSSERKEEKSHISDDFQRRLQEQPKLEEVAPLTVARVPENSMKELKQHYDEKIRANTRINGMLTIDNGEHQRQMTEYYQRAKELEIAKKEANQLREQKMLEERMQAENEFQKTIDAQRREQEEKFSSAKKIREDYEKETQRLMRETLEEMNRRTQALYHCFFMKMNFEAREKECSDWLAAVRAPITKARNQCFRFETYLGKQKIEDFERDMIMNDVLRLHRFTLVAWQTVFGACERAKYLFIKFQKPFLRIMLDNLVTVSDKLFYALMEIDTFLKEKQTIDYILQKFETMKPTDVLTTWELRDLEKSGHIYYGAIRDPLIYSNSFVKIEEIAEIQRSTSV